MTAQSKAVRARGGQGMNWIRKDKRLAIYLRDGLACVYCTVSVDDGARLTLDHLRPAGWSGSNRGTNLVTACVGCNSARGTKPWREFALAKGADSHKIDLRRKRSLRHLLPIARELMRTLGYKAALAVEVRL